MFIIVDITYDLIWIQPAISGPVSGRVIIMQIGLSPPLTLRYMRTPAPWRPLRAVYDTEAATTYSGVRRPTTRRHTKERAKRGGTTAVLYNRHVPHVPPHRLSTPMLPNGYPQG